MHLSTVPPKDKPEITCLLREYDANYEIDLKRKKNLHLKDTLDPSTNFQEHKEMHLTVQ